MPFRDFVKPGQEGCLSQATLAKEVLAEVPSQFLLFMTDNGIIPGAWDPDFSPPPVGSELLNGAVDHTTNSVLAPNGTNGT